jgi:magnesium chelatase subunit H
MKQRRIMPASAPPVRVVIITLDNHLAAAVERANATLARDNVSVALYAASDWDRDAGVLDRARADIARADIIIATMLFLEDHVRAIHPALVARREDCDAIVGLMSAGDIVKLTRLGGYRMDKPAKGPLALLKKLRGSSKPGASSGAGQMKMLRRLPKILRFVPGTAQDVRQYFLTLQYWLAGSDDNVVDMVRALVDRYASGPRAALKGKLPAQPPREYPEVGVYHPAIAGRLSEDGAKLPSKKGAKGTVGVLMLV